MKQRYRYECGTGSWHQRKAGHYTSGVLVVDHTPEEHATFMENMKRHNLPTVANIIEPLPTNEQIIPQC